MTEDYVAATFHKAMDYHKPDEVEQMVHWCLQQFGA